MNYTIVIQCLKIIEETKIQGTKTNVTIDNNSFPEYEKWIISWHCKDNRLPCDIEKLKNALGNLFLEANPGAITFKQRRS